MSSIGTRTDLSGTPSNATAKAALTALFDFVAQRMAAGTSGSGAASTAELQTSRESLAIGAYTSRNKVHNGDMTVAQRGASFAAPASGTYTLDRWQAYAVGTLVNTISQAADAPSSNEFQYSLRSTVTTIDNAIAAGDFACLTHKLEGYNARDLVGKTFVLGFWVRGSKSGIHNVAFSNSANDRSYVTEYTINVANTWEYKTVTVTGGLITTGTWNWTNSMGLSVLFMLYSGSTYQTTKDAWQVGNFQSTPAAVQTEGDTIGNIFAITGVQLEQGPVATQFEHRPFGTELDLCQRYFEKSFDIGVAPAQNIATYIGAQGNIQAIAAGLGTGFDFRFQMRKRATPTVVFYNPFAANAQARNSSSGTDTTALTAAYISESGVICSYTTAAASSAGTGSYFNWTAAAEL